MKTLLADLYTIMTADPVTAGFIVLIAALAVAFLLWDCAVKGKERDEP